MLKYIVPLIVGGVIGYITNDLAIKMLFRPRRAIYIGKFHIPFTPGLIPQQKSRIASSIGHVISEQLLDAQTLKKTVLSDEVFDAVNSKLEDIVASFSNDEHTLRERLSEYIGEERVENYEQLLYDKAAELIVQKLTQADIGAIVIENAVKAVKESMAGRPGVGMLAGLIDDSVINSLKAEMGPKINKMAENSEPMIKAEVKKNIGALLDMRVADICAKYSDKLPAVTDFLMGAIRSIVENNLEQAIAALNIEKIVVEKINAFSAQELEAMIFGIMKRELKAIVYLGALLGFLMGFVNVFLL